MNTTVKALIVGTLIVVAGLAAIHAATPAPVVKLDTVVVTAKRMPVQTDVVKLDTVLVTGSRADALAAQEEETTKQASAQFASRS